MDTFITKGTRVHVDFLAQKPDAIVSGSQPKIVATQVSFLGTIRHVRGNAPTQEASTDIRFWVEPDEGSHIPSDLISFCPKCGKSEVGMVKGSSLYLPKG